MSWYCHDCAKEAYERCCKICGQTRGEQRRKVTAQDRKAFQVRDKEMGLEKLTIFESEIVPQGKMFLMSGTICVDIADLDDPVVVCAIDFDGVTVNPTDMTTFKNICTANTEHH